MKWDRTALIYVVPRLKGIPYHCIESFIPDPKYSSWKRGDGEVRSGSERARAASVKEAADLFCARHDVNALDIRLGSMTQRLKSTVK